MKTRRIIDSVMVVLMLSTCSKALEEPDRMQFSLSETEITDQGKGTAASFTIHTTDATIWRIKPEGEYPWISFSETGGQAEREVTYVIEEHLGKEKRIAEYTVEAYLYGELYAVERLQIVQYPQIPFISISPDQASPLYEVSCFAHEYALDIVSNEEWEAKIIFPKEDKPEWLTITPMRGSGRIQVKISVLPNGSPSAREARIEFVSANAQARLFLAQKQYEPAEIWNLILHIDGMSGFIPDGTGKLSLVNLKDSRLETYAAEIRNAADMTDIILREVIISGSYHIAGYQSEGRTYDISREAALTVADTDSEISVAGWNSDFNTFHGGRHEDPVLLDSEGLLFLAQRVNSGARTRGLFFALEGPADLSAARWTSIGTPDTPFRGSFDGRNHTIKGFHIVASEMYNAFFGVVTGEKDAVATLENMVFRPTDASTADIDASAGAAFTSVICGAALDHVIIRNCQNYLNMKFSHMSGPVAGAVGTAVLMQYLTPEPVNVLIENCHNYGDVELCPSAGMNWNLGGIVGANKGTIRCCSNQGDIKNSNNSLRAMHVGGIAGNNAGIISQCYTTGDMSGRISQAGGIVGLGSACQTWIENCYSTGDLQTSESPAGGVIGTVPGSNKSAFLHMINCYSSGRMGGQKTGGVIGVLGNAANYIIRFCACSSPVNASGGNKFAADEMKLKWGERFRKLEPELWCRQSTFTTEPWVQGSAYLPLWDFDDVWGIDEGSSAPYLLRNEQLPHPIIK